MSISLLAEAVVPASAGWVEWDIASHVKDAIYNGLSNVDLLLKFENEDASDTETIFFWSKENSTLNPYLNIDGVNIAPSKDSSLVFDSPNTNYGSYASLALYRGVSTKRRYVVSFSLTGISDLVNATFKIYIHTINNSVNKSLIVCKLTRSDWVETEVTWNNYKAGTPWTTAGGDYTDVSNMPDGAQVIFNADLVRQVLISKITNTDTVRKTYRNQEFTSDALRVVVNGVSQLINIDTLRQVIKSEIVDTDTKRIVISSEIINIDTVRKLLYGSVGDSIIYLTVNDSISINLSVTDAITFNLKVAD